MRGAAATFRKLLRTLQAHSVHSVRARSGACQGKVRKFMKRTAERRAVRSWLRLQCIAEQSDKPAIHRHEVSGALHSCDGAWLWVNTWRLGPVTKHHLVFCVGSLLTAQAASARLLGLAPGETQRGFGCQARPTGVRHGARWVARALAPVVPKLSAHVALALTLVAANAPSGVLSAVLPKHAQGCQSCCTRLTGGSITNNKPGLSSTTALRGKA